MELNHHKLPRLTADQVFEPWEMEGRSRLDCLPHRASMLKGMAYCSIIAGGVSLVCFAPALLGLALASAAWFMARQDLTAICKGEMDHDGFHSTEQARADAVAGIFICLIAAFLWSLAITLFLLLKF
jgi:hypothetical protein